MKVRLANPAIRKFLPADLKFEVWDDAAAYFDDLQQRAIHTLEELQQWLKDSDELHAAIDETGRWLYIQSTCDTESEEIRTAFQAYAKGFKVKARKVFNELNKRLANHPLKDSLPEEYAIYLRSVDNQLELFREENLAIVEEIREMGTEYHRIKGAVEVEIDGKKYTPQKVRQMMGEADRSLREKAFRASAERELEDRELLEDLFDKMLAARQQMAVNAGFDNFRDFSFRALGRFDYGPEDCIQFHDSIQKKVLPELDKLMAYRKERLGLEQLRPWDLGAPLHGETLVPFDSTDDLVEKAIDCLAEVHPYFGECLATMRDAQYLDLEARKGKAPGGYNMRMPECKVPFVFMNSVGSAQDVQVMHHEAGHAVHAFLSADLELSAFADYPAEVAELAAMTMELLTLEHAHKNFYPSDEEIKKAKYAQLSKIVQMLPWVAVIDKFQHWLYTNPGHSREERRRQWRSILSEFTSSELNEDGLDKFLDYRWHRQLHVFLNPFYYVEYGMAQLGALAIWKNYCADPDKAVAAYMEALRLGYTKSIGELYDTAGIRFDFSEAYIADIMNFVRAEAKNALV